MALEQVSEQVQDRIQENLKQVKLVDAVVERSYLESVKKEEQERGEIRYGEITIALSKDCTNTPIFTIASKSDILVEQYQNMAQKPHIERPCIIELPEEDYERIGIIETINALQYLGKREKARQEQRERLLNYERGIDR